MQIQDLCNLKVQKKINKNRPINNYTNRFRLHNNNKFNKINKLLKKEIKINTLNLEINKLKIFETKKYFFNIIILILPNFNC